MTNKEKNILAELKKKARSKSQKCYTPFCNKKAIRSHIQQVEGSIRDIASSNGKIIQLENLDSRFNNMPYDFKEKGIKQKGDVLTFWGFCNSCDTKIFKEIESRDIDYSIYRNQLLYSYRALLSEHYKQEYNLKWYKLIFESKELSEATKNSFRKLNEEFSLAVKFDKYVKLMIENDLKENTKSFEFIHFVLPRIEICTSAVYSLPVLIYFKNHLQKNAIQTQEIIPPVCSTIFINLIPNLRELHVILGCDIDKSLRGRIDLKKILNSNQTDKIKLISDILIKHVETWFVSVSLYNIWKKRKIDREILDQMKKYQPIEMKFKYVKFNMFHDIL